MPNRFCCKHCGMITDNPTIVPLPKEDAFFRELKNEIENLISKHSAVEPIEIDIALRTWEHNLAEEKLNIYCLKYNHSITCPVCLNETRFWRKEGAK